MGKENHKKSLEEKILQLAYDIRSDLFDRDPKTSSIVKKYFM